MSVRAHRELTRLRRIAARVLRMQDAADSRVEVFFENSETMSRLKWRYLRRRQKLVDVLAFPEDHDGFPHPEASSKGKKKLGEIYLNWEAFGQDGPYLTYLLLHGVLHLLGYMHDKKSDMIVMQQLESKLCRHIGDCSMEPRARR
jgi:rRNA maturation RNase YbeY